MDLGGTFRHAEVARSGIPRLGPLFTGQSRRPDHFQVPLCPYRLVVYKAQRKDSASSYWSRVLTASSYPAAHLSPVSPILAVYDGSTTPPELAIYIPVQCPSREPRKSYAHPLQIPIGPVPHSWSPPHDHHDI